MILWINWYTVFWGNNYLEWNDNSLVYLGHKLEDIFSLLFSSPCEEFYVEKIISYNRTWYVIDKVNWLKSVVSIDSQAELYRVQKSYDRAEPLYLDAISILEEAFGQDDVR